jgi:hypothetical protein
LGESYKQKKGDILDLIMQSEGVDESNIAHVYLEFHATKGLRSQRDTLSYSNNQALQNAKTFCGQNSNPCGVFLLDPAQKLSDCAHFIAHCLSAGGLKIATSDPTANFCPDGLAVRNSDLIAGLRDAANKFSNVQEVVCDETAIGDVGFLNAIVRPSHAFMICKRFAPCTDEQNPPTVYAHTTNRCCGAMELKWYQFFGTAFRLADG